MLNRKATVSIALDKRRQKSDKTYPVKIRVIFNKSPRYYSTGYSLTLDDFDKVMSIRPRGEAKDIRIHLNSILNDAQRIADNISPFDFDEFKRQLKGEPEKQNSDFYNLFTEYIEALRKADRAGTAISYGDALNSLRLFHPKNISPNRVTRQYFEKYEAWMKNRGRADATIGMYVRAARTILNYAIEQGVMDAARYPFNKGGYKPPVGENIKKALTIDQVRSLATYTPENDKERMYRDFWLLSYLCNGANIVDLLKLTTASIRDNTIIFRRQKTKRTKRGNQKSVVVTLSKQVRDIIETHGDIDSEGYIFPYLKQEYSEKEMLMKTKLFIKLVNKYINRIAKKVGIDVHITTYTARHSYATIMKRAGVPIAFISDSLGHSDIRITERYLAGFEDEYRAKVSEALTDW